MFVPITIFALWFSPVDGCPVHSITHQQFFSKLAPAEFPASLNPYPTKPLLTFSPSGTFKITVFSDLHYGENPWDDWGPLQDVNSAKLMRTVLGDEKPDYVYV